LQIENEDELDDAKRPEDRKEEEQDGAPPPDEKNGIEMSEDFDGAMEDAPTTEVIVIPCPMLFHIDMK